MDILQSTKMDILQRLREGVVVGDGSMMMTLEKRGYVSVGSWTPEATVLYPDAVRQLHREFLRAGADVMQTCTYFCNDRFEARKAYRKSKRHDLKSADMNSAACDLAKEVADEGDALVAGCLSPLLCYEEKKGKEFVQGEIRKQCKLYSDKEVDFFLGEWYANVEEAEWAIETMKESDRPVACTMRICPIGDLDGVSPEECAVRMAKAGADIIGINCMYDPDICLRTLGLMKSGLDSAGLHQVLLMAQPAGFHTQEIATNPHGYNALPEFPFAMETRVLSRLDVQKFARKAYQLGVRYIGGCCGFEPYHIRAIAEELAEERGKRPPGADMSPGFDGLKMSSQETQRQRANPDYWKKLIPAAGRHDVKKVADIPC